MAGVVEGENVRMGETRHHADLAQEPLRLLGGRHLRTQHLERDVAVVLQIVGLVDEGHPTTTELLLDPILPVEGAGQAIVKARHAWKMHEAGSGCESVLPETGDERQGGARKEAVTPPDPAWW